MRVALTQARLCHCYAIVRWLYACASILFFGLAIDAETNWLFPKEFVRPAGIGYILYHKSRSWGAPFVCGLLSGALCLTQRHGRTFRGRPAAIICCSVCSCICMGGYMWWNPPHGFSYLRDPFVQQPWWQAYAFLSRLFTDRAFLLAQALICFVSVLSVGSVLMMRSDIARRGLGSHCNYCDYDLTGNVSGICPECGHVTGQAAEKASPISPRLVKRKKLP